jgi:LPXTG-site transpeptidase (sortase) family protein
MPMFRLIVLIAWMMFSAVKLLYAQDAPLPPTLVIPDLKVQHSLTQFPLGQMTWDIPPDYTGLGTLEGTAQPHQPGNVIIAGHSEMPDGSDGIFARLEELQPGMLIWLYTGEQMRVYRVARRWVVDEGDLRPLYPSRKDQLTLLTCEVASFDAQSQTYANRVVIVALPVR